MLNCICFKSFIKQKCKTFIFLAFGVMEKKKAICVLDIIIHAYVLA